MNIKWKEICQKIKRSFAGSIKARVTFCVLIFSLLGIWSLSFFSGFVLRKEMGQVLGEQQFSTVSIFAANISDQTEERMKALETIAAVITPTLMMDQTAVQTFLESRRILLSLFNAGLIICDVRGETIADVPNSMGRKGLNYADAEFMTEALKGKSIITKPLVGRKLKIPIFVMATPIHNSNDKVIGVLAGITDLGSSNYISNIIDNSYGKTGGYLLVSPQTRTIIYATDKKRIMELLPDEGVNKFIDQAICGWEGFGLATAPTGVEVLSSIKQIPIAKWYLVALIPTKEAFAPVILMLQYLLPATIFLSLLASILNWNVLKKQLAPVFDTISTLAKVTRGDSLLQPLPVSRQDEIGMLIGSFNRLLADLGQQEALLLEREASFRYIIDNSFDVIFTLDAKGNFMFVSPALEWHLNYPIHEMVHNNYENFVHPEDVELCRKYLVRVLETGQFGTSPEYRVKHADGSWRWFITNGSSYVDSKGELRFIGTGHDITERKRQDAEKFKLGKLESLGVLAGGIAHDFNNLLQGLTGNISMALGECQAGEQKQLLADALVAAERSSLLTRQLLAFARGGIPERAIGSIGDVIQESVRLSLGSGSAVSCELTLPKDLWLADMNAGQIGQVIKNLIINGRQAMAESGCIKIQAENMSKEDSVHLAGLEGSGAYVHISVSDTGIGIPKEYLEKIFDPYFTTKGKQGGSGLGLAICHTVMQDHQGKITVESEHGKGTTFHLYLPAIQQTMEEQPTKKKVSFEALHQLHVLVMDDDEAIGMLAKRMLEKQNHQVQLAAHGQEAIELYSQQLLTKDPFHLVILDLIIPGKMGGLETLERLKELDPAVVAIVSSGYAEDLPAEFDAVLPKPYTVNCLKEVLQKKEIRQKIKNKISIQTEV